MNFESWNLFDFHLISLETQGTKRVVDVKTNVYGTILFSFRRFTIDTQEYVLSTL